MHCALIFVPLVCYCSSRACTRAERFPFRRKPCIHLVQSRVARCTLRECSRNTAQRAGVRNWSLMFCVTSRYYRFVLSWVLKHVSRRCFLPFASRMCPCTSHEVGPDLGTCSSQCGVITFHYTYVPGLLDWWRDYRSTFLFQAFTHLSPGISCDLVRPCEVRKTSLYDAKHGEDVHPDSVCILTFEEGRRAKGGRKVHHV